MKSLIKILFCIIVTSTLPTEAYAEANKFPEGKWRGLSFEIKTEGGASIDQSQLDFFESQADVTLIGQNQVKIKLCVKIRRVPGEPLKVEECSDQYKITWEASDSGKLTNIDSSRVSSEFKIDGNTISIRSWLPIHKAWETQVYLVANTSNAQFPPSGILQK